MTAHSHADRKNDPARTKDVAAWDQQHTIHPWRDLTAPPLPMTQIARAQGIYLIDGAGNKIIDGPGGMWCVNIGYGRQEMADAIAAQVMEMNYASPWFTCHEPGAMLAQKLSTLAPAGLNHVFFTNGGSDAVDTALRFLFYRNNVLGKPQKKKILCREQGYHGSSYLAASVSSTGGAAAGRLMDRTENLPLMLPDINPALRPDNMSPDGMRMEAWCDAKINDMRERIDSVGAENIACFIAEPVLASGGVIVPPPDYHQRAWELCRQHDIVYIADEVVTAFGRLGHWFASHEVFGITPDIITCAKGLTSGYVPMGAVLIADALLDSISGIDGAHPFTNGYTYSGHPVAARAALTNIGILEREGILQHVRDLAPYFQESLRALGAKYPIIGEARGVGLLGCLEGVAEDFGARMDALCEARGLLVRPIGNMCVFSPPLIISRAETATMFQILDDALRAMQENCAS